MQNSTCFLPPAVCLLLTVLNDPTTANHFIAAIKNRCLARSNGALWFIERHPRATVRQGRDCGGRSSVAIANANFRAYWLRRAVERNPVHACGAEFIAQQFVVVTNDDAIACRLNAKNVKRFCVGDADPTSLPNGIAMNARVPANHISVSGDDLTFARQACSLLFRFKVAIDET